MKTFKRYSVTVGASSLLLLSACHPWLSSRGETHSPYQPQAQSQNNSASNGNAVSTSQKPSNPISPKPPLPSPSPSATPENPDKDKSLAIAEDQVLKFTFNEGFTLPYDNKVDDPKFDSAGCRSIRIQAGQFQKEPDRSHFSCLAHYCVYRPSSDSDLRMQLKIQPKTTYLFRRFETDESGDGLPHVSLQWLNGGSKVGKVDQLNCDGYGGTLTVGDLIDTFGAGSAKDSKIVDVRIVPITSLIAPQSTPANPANRALPSSQSQAPSLKNIRRPASAQEISQTSKPLESNQELKAELPNFALQLTGSVSAFGGSTISPAQQNVKSGAMLVQLEYQPDFFQHFGILSIGPSVGTYPTLGKTSSDQKVTSGFFSITGVGGQARYQLHYFDDQFLVPYVSYEAQSLSYRINEGGSGRMTVAGGSGGFSLLLNRLAPGEASDMYRSLGVSRSYLVIEGKYLSGSDQNVRVNGTSVYFGLRFER